MQPRKEKEDHQKKNKNNNDKDFTGNSLADKMLSPLLKLYKKATKKKEKGKNAITSPPNASDPTDQSVTTFTNQSVTTFFDPIENESLSEEVAIAPNEALGSNEDVSHNDAIAPNEATVSPPDVSLTESGVVIELKEKKGFSPYIKHKFPKLFDKKKAASADRNSNTQQDQAAISLLPNECLSHVLSYLHLQELKSANYTCKLFYSSIKQDKLIDKRALDYTQPKPELFLNFEKDRAYNNSDLSALSPENIYDGSLSFKLVKIEDSNHTDCSETKHNNISNRSQIVLTYKYTPHVKPIPLKNGNLAMVMNDDLLFTEQKEKNTFKILMKYNGKNAIYALTKTPTENVICTTGWPTYSIVIWNGNTGKCKTILKGHNDSIYCVVTLPNGNYVSSSADFTLRIWDHKTGQCIQTLDVGCTLTSLATLKDGSIAGAYYESSIRLWRFATLHESKLKAKANEVELKSEEESPSKSKKK